LQNEKQRLIQAQGERETSLFGLSRLLNLDPRQAIELGDSLSFFETPQPEVENEHRASPGGALRMEVACKSRFARRKTRKRPPARRGSFPELQRELGGTGNVPLRRNSHLQLCRDGERAAVTGGRIRAQTVRADLEIQRLQQQQMDLRNAIGQDVKTAPD